MERKGVLTEKEKNTGKKFTEVFNDIPEGARNDLLHIMEGIVIGAKYAGGDKKPA